MHRLGAGIKDSLALQVVTLATSKGGGSPKICTSHAAPDP